ncbi:MAG: hypothetical protein J5757_00745 [Lachnospiraceae bacterium]|nr:hypothetical protein [Lachnospiraceae bacterium]
MPENMNEEIVSKDVAEKKIPSVYFANTFKNRLIALAGIAFFYIGGVVLLANTNLVKSAILAFLLAFVFLGDLLDVVIVGRKKIYRMHFFHVSSVIKRNLITICSTSKGKYGDEIYLYGYGSHMTMLRSKHLWEKLMEVIGIPEDVREKLDVCEGDLYEEQLAPDLHVRSQRALIDYLLHSEYYVSVEIRRTFPESFYEEMAANERPTFLDSDDETEETEEEKEDEEQ